MKEVGRLGTFSFASLGTYLTCLPYLLYLTVLSLGSCDRSSEISRYSINKIGTLVEDKVRKVL